MEKVYICVDNSFLTIDPEMSHFDILQLSFRIVATEKYSASFSWRKNNLSFIESK